MAKLNERQRKLLNKLFINGAKKQFKIRVKKAHQSVFDNDIFKGIDKTTNP